MKYAETAPVVDRLRIRGQYERNTTDTASLAAELSSPNDLGRLTTDFDRGVTPLRDVGGMITAQRGAILDAYERGTVGDMSISHPELLAEPVANLHARVTRGRQDQPIGHNFFMNAKGFLDAKLPWAMQFDSLLRARTGYGICDISGSNDTTGKDNLLADITENPDSQLMTTLGVYLAGRSLEGELFLEHQYGDVMRQAKGATQAITQSVGMTTGLRVDMIERAAKQLHRATFGSFDHLARLVTSGNTGANGDYLAGSLRIEVQFDGKVDSLRIHDETDARSIITHELQHATSAQEGSRLGLQMNGQGLEANEGMTEYLAQLSLGSPGIEGTADGGPQVHESVPYRVPVFAMLVLHEQFKAGKNQHFAVLFNAYHGDVRSSVQLEQALDAFYQYDIDSSLVV